MSYRYNDDAWLDQAARKLIIAGYAEMIKRRVDDGGRPNYVNFMFNHIPGSAATKMDAMTAEVTRVHNILTRNIVKRPKAKLWCHLRPIFIGCHDLQVWKHEKQLVRNFVVNDGLHFNVLALVPKESDATIPMRLQFALWGRRSNLTVPLIAHFEDRERFYLTDVLSRIDVSPVKAGTIPEMTDYALKAFKHGRVGPDSIQVWN